MDEERFRQFLRKFGKKPHVIDGLIAQVGRFEQFLVERSSRLADATPKDFDAYITTLDPSRIATGIRGLEVYFHFVGSVELAQIAHAAREQRIARTRRAFKVAEFRGVNASDAAKLEAVGIVTVNDMLAAGRTPICRQQLADQVKLPLSVILELVKLSDLSRLGAIKAVRARLYYDAGLDTPDKFVDRDPDTLHQMLVDFVERTGFPGIAPLPKEIRNAVTAASTLPSVVEYE